jgi:uncharacterized alkaline shock family protein YloU
VEGHSLIAPDVLGTYAADAAQEVKGVQGLVEGGLRHHGVKVVHADGAVNVELHLALEWGSSTPDVGRAVQASVAGYLERMADVRPQTVDVVVASIASPGAQ